ncbi:MAG: hypothetical protein PWQ25_1827 [Deferribacteres bacterium]|jgi:hypothetical protein|nr:hypothetical protein [Deferribacteres bacterium]
MKRFNKYFGGEYLKYWYVAFLIVLAVMVFDFYNDRSVEAYRLTIYDSTGNVVEKREISRYELSRSNIVLPITKSFEPIKRF